MQLSSCSQTSSCDYPVVQRQTTVVARPEPERSEPQRNVRIHQEMLDNNGMPPSQRRPPAFAYGQNLPAKGQQAQQLYNTIEYQNGVELMNRIDEYA